MRFFDAAALLGFGELALQFAVARLCGIKSRLRSRKFIAFERGTLSRLGGGFDCAFELFAPIGELFVRPGTLGFVLCELLFERSNLLVDAVAAIALVLNLLFELGYFGIRRVHLALHGMQLIAGGVMFCARGFQAALRLSQARGFGFQLIHQARYFARGFLPLHQGIAFAQKPQHVL